MSTSVQTKLTLFAENTRAIKKEFSWQNAMTKRLAALLYALDGKPIDISAIRSCHETRRALRFSLKKTAANLSISNATR